MDRRLGARGGVRSGGAAVAALRAGGSAAGGPRRLRRGVGGGGAGAAGGGGAPGGAGRPAVGGRAQRAQPRGAGALRRGADPQHRRGAGGGDGPPADGRAGAQAGAAGDRARPPRLAGGAREGGVADARRRGATLLALRRGPQLSGPAELRARGLPRRVGHGAAARADAAGRPLPPRPRRDLRRRGQLSPLVRGPPGAPRGRAVGGVPRASALHHPRGYGDDRRGRPRARAAGDQRRHRVRQRRDARAGADQRVRAGGDHHPAAHADGPPRRRHAAAAGAARRAVPQADRDARADGRGVGREPAGAGAARPRAAGGDAGARRGDRDAGDRRPGGADRRLWLAGADPRPRRALRRSGGRPAAAAQLAAGREAGGDRLLQQVPRALGPRARHAVGGLLKWPAQPGRRGRGDAAGGLQDRRGAAERGRAAGAHAGRGPQPRGVGAGRDRGAGPRPRPGADPGGDLRAMVRGEAQPRESTQGDRRVRPAAGRADDLREGRRALPGHPSHRPRQRDPDAAAGSRAEPGRGPRAQHLDPAAAPVSGVLLVAAGGVEGRRDRPLRDPQQHRAAADQGDGAVARRLARHRGGRDAAGLSVDPRQPGRGDAGQAAQLRDPDRSPGPADRDGRAGPRDEVDPRRHRPLRDARAGPAARGVSGLDLASGGGGRSARGHRPGGEGAAVHRRGDRGAQRVPAPGPQ